MKNKTDGPLLIKDSAKLKSQMIHKSKQPVLYCNITADVSHPILFIKFVWSTEISSNVCFIKNFLTGYSGIGRGPGLSLSSLCQHDTKLRDQIHPLKALSSGCGSGNPMWGIPSLQEKTQLKKHMWVYLLSLSIFTKVINPFLIQVSCQYTLLFYQIEP